MEYNDVARAVRNVYWEVLMTNDAEAREAARRMAEWLGMDPAMADIMADDEFSGTTARM